ncbi:MAG: SET domain-containing protein-lysine N-methyltransferase [Ginsengibacter sp.]
MALLEKQLIIKRSTIPGAGKGLFTKQNISKGERILEYKGRITTWKDVLNGKKFNGYVYYVTRNHVIDAMSRLKSLGRYANDAKGITRIKGVTNNSKYVQEGKKVYVEAVKDIPAHTEILVPYGKDYWQVIQDNIKILEKEAKAIANKQ